MLRNVLNSGVKWRCWWLHAEAVCWRAWSAPWLCNVSVPAPVQGFPKVSKSRWWLVKWLNWKLSVAVLAYYNIFYHFTCMCFACHWLLLMIICNLRVVDIITSFPAKNKIKSLETLYLHHFFSPLILGTYCAEPYSVFLTFTTPGPTHAGHQMCQH